MEMIVSVLIACAFGASARKKGYDGFQWGARLSTALLVGLAILAFWHQAAGTDPLTHWAWIVFVSCGASIYLYNKPALPLTASSTSAVRPGVPRAPEEKTLGSVNVILLGTIADERERQTTERLFAQLINKPQELAAQLINGQETVLKGNLDPIRGQEYVAALTRIGVACRVEPSVLEIDDVVRSART